MWPRTILHCYTLSSIGSLKCQTTKWLLGPIITVATKYRELVEYRWLYHTHVIHDISWPQEERYHQIHLIDRNNTGVYALSYTSIMCLRRYLFNSHTEYHSNSTAIKITPCSLRDCQKSSKRGTLSQSLCQRKHWKGCSSEPSLDRDITGRLRTGRDHMEKSGSEFQNCSQFVGYRSGGGAKLFLFNSKLWAKPKHRGS